MEQGQGPEVDLNKVIEKLGYKIANLEIQFSYEQAQKEHYMEEYHKLKAVETEKEAKN